jgi:hypothetical protein
MNLRKFILLILILVCKHSTAQYFAVNDPDGYVNVRANPGINAEIICRLDNETIVYETYDEDADPKSNWLHVHFYLPKKSGIKNKEDYTPEIMIGYNLHSGYISRAKLMAIEKLRQLKYKQLKNGYSCFNDSVKINVTISPFIASNHKIKNTGGFFEKVDNLPMIGTDGSKPRDEIKQISMSVNNTPVIIPQEKYKNLFNPSYNNYAYTDEKGAIYLIMHNSDGAGTYSCIFIFRGGRFVGRLIFEGDC